MAILLLVSGCTPDPGAAAATVPDGTYPVESVFREFYTLLGAEKNLGYAISPLVEDGNIKMQYTEAALMRYDSMAGASQKLSLAPLGLELRLKDQPIVLPDQSGERIIDGYIIYDEFVPLYDALQGARFAGRPLTQVRIDYERGRIEQYFANIGFYRLMEDPPKTVHLLAYGSWKCDAYCRYQGQANAKVAPLPVFPEPLVSSLSRLGPDFTGRPLSEPYIAQDGMLEQVYENFVVYANPVNVRLISLRPITAEVGFPPTDLVPKNEDDRVVFYPVEPGLGHHVPKVFEAFITLHGGLEISGMPATELFPFENLYRQCFTNYCLDYDPNAAESLRIRPAPLGEEYLQIHPPTQVANANLELSSGSYHMGIWEARSLIPSGQVQTIHLEVTEAESQNPVPDLEATVVLYTPGGSQTTLHFQPTDASGQAVLDLPPITGANGTLVPYTVCLNTASGAPLCVKESYVLWGNP